VYDTNTHTFAGAIKRPGGGPFADCADCQLYVREPDEQQQQQQKQQQQQQVGASSSAASASHVVTAGLQELYIAWPDAIKVCVCVCARACVCLCVRVC
jgi:hypothetical protein